MIPKTFSYFAPISIAEALSLLDKYKDEAKIIAGGTDLMVMLSDREVSPRYIVDISNSKELGKIEDGKDFLRIGALTTHSVLESSRLIREKANILSEAAHQVGSVQIRNRGTIGGNLVNASPAADLAPALLALNANLKLVKSSGERLVPVEKFFTGVNRTVIGSNELLTEIQIPHQRGQSKGEIGGAFLKIGRRSSLTISVGCVAAVLTVNNGKCDDARIGLGAVAPTPIRAVKAETFLKGKVIDEDVMNKASEIASGETDPISDVRSSAEYRKIVSKVLVKRAIQQAIKRISKS